VLAELPELSYSPDIERLLDQAYEYRERASRPNDEFQMAFDMRGLRHAIDLLELDFAERASVLEEIATDPEPVYNIVKHGCRMGGGQVFDRLRIARHMESLPGAVAAVVEGRIGFGHLSVMAEFAERCKKWGAVVNVGLLVQMAETNSVSKLRLLCQRRRHQEDAKGAAMEQAEAVEARRLELFELEGGLLYSLRGVLDPVGAGLVRSALEPLAKKRDADDDRPKERRMADALLELVSGRRPAALNVTCTMEGLLGQPAPGGEVEFSAPLPAATIGRLACDCSVRRILLDQDSVVIDVGRARRLISPSQRRALEAMSPYCHWPGCDRSASYCDGHHLKHWIEGGHTDLPNLALLCWYHHNRCHEQGWRLVRTEKGDLLPIRPPVTRWSQCAQFRPPSRR
jgi:hypothetical protein